MKARRFILTLAAAAVMAAGVGNGSGATNEVSGLLQKGLFEEEANHNLDAAIQAYQGVVTQTDKDHQFAATAIFRLGECYRKQGKTNEANAEYQRVLREFPDQTELAALSRQQLGAAAEPIQGATPNEGQIAEIRKLSPEKRRVAVQQMFPNPVLNSLMQKMTETEQELAKLKNDLGPQHPDVTRSEAVLKTIRQQIDDQVEAVLASRQQLGSAAGQVANGPVAGQRPPQRGADALNADLKAFHEAEEIKRLQAMIKESPDLINAHESAWGETPLHQAVLNNWPSVVKFLSENHADMEQRDNSGGTPLIVAAQGRTGYPAPSKEMVELLLSEGADVNATETGFDQHYTALHRAAENGYKAIAEVLLEHGAKVDGRAGGNRTPLMIASAKGFKTVVDVLLDKGAEVNAKDNKGNTALVSAVSAGNRAITEYLLAHGAQINLTNNEGKSVLFTTIEGGRAPMVEFLLANKADVNLKTPDGFTPLIDAVNGKKTEIIKMLLEHGADVNAKMSDTHPDTRRWTALDAAVSMNENELVKLLLEHHADPNLTFDLLNNNEENATPLMMAAWSNQKQNVKTLLEYKANPNLKNADGFTALWNGFWQHADQDEEVAALLLDNKADTEFKYSQGRTVLQWAAANGSTNFAKLFLAHGARTDARDDTGETPLHLANSQPMVELLLAHGADVNAKDNQGETPLDLSIRRDAARPRYVGSPPRPQPVLTSVGGGSTPFAYRWQFGGTSGTDGAGKDIGDILREHGGVAEVDVATIRVMREGKLTPVVVFQKDATGQNHFTLYEVLVGVYGAYDSAVRRDFSFLQRGNPWEWPRSMLTFPDLSNLKIIHLAEKGRAQADKVDVEKALAGGDCSGNIPLQWGDIVDFPELDHNVSDNWPGLPEPMQETLSKCLERHIKIIVKGKETDVALAPLVSRVPRRAPWTGGVLQLQLPPPLGPGQPAPAVAPAPVAPAPAVEPAKELSIYWLSGVVNDARVVLASSDLARVKIKRVEAGTGKTKEIIFNLEKIELNSDLWLEDGDVIEIPEK